MRLNKRQRQFAKIIAAHGMTLEGGGKHILIKKGGKTVSSLSNSPSDDQYFKQAIRCLVADGLLPSDLKRTNL